MVHGGIKRLKQHLAGGYGDAVMCQKTTTPIRKQMTDYLESNRRKRPLYLDDDDDDDDEQQQQEQEGEADVVVVEGTAPELESQTSKAHPSSGTAIKQRRATYSYKVAAASKAKAKPKGNKTILEMLRKTPEELVDERRKGCFQPTIQSSTKTKE